MTKRLTICRPDDCHVHFRDGPMLEVVVPHTARLFARALVMPNTEPPILTLECALAYRSRILDACPPDADFAPLMTLYLTHQTTPDQIRAAAAHGAVLAVKLYPVGATTNARHGVRDIDSIAPQLDALSETGLALCVHGETPDPSVDIFDREAVFIERWIEPMRRRHPRLRIVLEHITTREAVEYVRSASDTLAASITAHHMVITRTDMLAGGIRPHLYCLPVAKREAHRAAVAAAATSGDDRFFLGTDSAPHRDGDKQARCGCAGIFSAPNALAWVAHVFDAADALDHLEAFTSIHGAKFYGLTPNGGRLTLERHAPPPPARLIVGDDHLSLFDPGFPCTWRVAA